MRERVPPTKEDLIKKSKRISVKEKSILEANTLREFDFIGRWSDQNMDELLAHVHREDIPDDWKEGPERTDGVWVSQYQLLNDPEGEEGILAVVEVVKVKKKFRGTFSDGLDAGAYETQGYLVGPTGGTGIPRGVFDNPRLVVPFNDLESVSSWVQKNWKIID
jgi:hypothetical protein